MLIVMRFLTNDFILLIMKVRQCIDMFNSSDCVPTTGGNENEDDLICSRDNTGNDQCRNGKEKELVSDSGGGTSDHVCTSLLFAMVMIWSLMQHSGYCAWHSSATGHTIGGN